MTASFRSVAQWPDLLVGPMVRRVTDTEAHIFVATKRDLRATVALHSGLHAASGGSAFHQSTLTTLKQIGEHLWVGLITVQFPLGAVSAGAPVSYDLTLTEPDGSSPQTLASLGLLSGDTPLGYTSGALPSFVVPPASVGGLRLVHGSCRKPHGGKPEEPDALQLVDAAIAASSASDRPQQLILTGDQIYADDVAAAVLDTCADAGEKLIGRRDAIPAEGGRADLLKPGWRSLFLALNGVDLKPVPTPDHSDYSGRHLLRFGEWCAMYLLAWSDALWPRNADGTIGLPDPPAASSGSSAFSALATSLEQDGVDVRTPVQRRNGTTHAAALLDHETRVRNEWTETAAKAVGYGTSTPNARRVLANIATFTMFDDHEITDDWYLNQDVHDRLKGRGTGTTAEARVGRRLLRNGLLAYAIFQHWGNSPEDFNTGNRGAALLDLWGPGTSGTDWLDNESAAADTLLDIGAADPTIPSAASQPSRRHAFDRIRWDYAIEFPAHRLIALDTRTWRDFPNADPLSWADLEARPPNAPGVPTADGAGQISVLAQSWIDNTPGTLITRFAGLTKAVAQLAESAGAGRTTVLDKAATAIARTWEFLEHAENALPASVFVLDPAAQTLIEGAGGSDGAGFRTTMASAPVSELLGAAADHLTAARDAGWRSAATITDTFEALSDLVDAAGMASSRGTALAARAAADAMDDTLWAVLDNGNTRPQAVEDAGNAAISSIDSRLAAVGVDALADVLLNDRSNRLGAGLISDAALAFQLTGPLQQVGSDLTTTVLLSPAPIFGNRLVELVQRIGLLTDLANGGAAEEEYDFEPWGANIPAMKALLRAGSPARNMIVLSGDVHYAGSSVNRPRGTGGRSCNWIQLTSSSTRNSDGATRGLALLDQLLYGNSDQEFFLQNDWSSIISDGGSAAAHLLAISRGHARQFINDEIDNFDLGTAVRAAMAGFGARLAPDVAEAIREAVSEARTEIGIVAAFVAALELMGYTDFIDDRYLATTLEVLSSTGAERARLRQAFRETFQLDPAEALQFHAKALRDLRSNRIVLYPGANARFSGADRHWRATWENAERRTVGMANCGFITIETQNGQPVRVHHELRFYPIDEPPSGSTTLPRTDWMGTLHVAPWAGQPM